jgi:hypothetical protein
MDRKRVFIIAAAVVIAATGVLCCVIAYVGRQSGGQTGQIVAGADEDDVFFDFKGETAAEREAENATCRAKVTGDKARAFEMRFSRRENIEQYIKGGENIYFASVDYGNGPVAIPMENVKILEDIKTAEYVLTLVPTGGDVDAGRAEGSTVRFYIASPEAECSFVLFMASAKCEGTVRD